jgi:haloacetate dehalogenase
VSGRAAWHARRQPEQRFTLVLCDLRGYGDSTGPAPDADASNYSERVMAVDLVRLMDEPGCPRFGLASHDRGGWRTASRSTMREIVAASTLTLSLQC